MFRAKEIVESQRKEVWSLLYITSMMDIFFIFKYTDPETWDYYYFADQPTNPK